MVVDSRCWWKIDPGRADDRGYPFDQVTDDVPGDPTIARRCAVPAVAIDLMGYMAEAGGDPTEAIGGCFTFAARHDVYGRKVWWTASTLLPSGSRTNTPK